MNIKRKGCFFLLSSPSGGGKTTVKNEVLKHFPEIEFSVSYTTREPRENEVDKKDYHFVSKEKFEQMIKSQSFLEYAQVHSHYYGTSREVLQKIEQGIDVLTDMDVQGALQVKENMLGAVLIFLVPPSWAMLEERLNNRGTDSNEQIEQRMNTARKEMDFYKHYDYLIINDNLDQTIRQVGYVIWSERSKVPRLEVDINGFYSN